MKNPLIFWLSAIFSVALPACRTTNNSASSEAGSMETAAATSPAVPETPFVWSYIGTYYYLGGTGAGVINMTTAFESNYLVIEATSFCAPRVDNVKVATGVARFDAVFVKGGVSGVYTQALYRITAPENVIPTSVTLDFSATVGLGCRVNVAGIRAQ